MAAFEYEHLSKRIREGHERVRAQGKRIGRPRTTANIKIFAKIPLRAKRNSTPQIVDLDLGMDNVQGFTSAKEVREKRRKALGTAIRLAKATEEPVSAARALVAVRTESHRL